MKGMQVKRALFALLLGLAPAVVTAGCDDGDDVIDLSDGAAKDAASDLSSSTDTAAATDGTVVGATDAGAGTDAESRSRPRRLSPHDPSHQRFALVPAAARTGD